MHIIYIQYIYIYIYNMHIICTNMLVAARNFALSLNTEIINHDFSIMLFAIINIYRIN